MSRPTPKRFPISRRMTQLTGVVARHALAAWWARRDVNGGVAHRLAACLGIQRTRIQETRKMGEPERLRLLFQELGGAFLKLGQMLAMQPDLLPPAYGGALLDLLDRVPAEDFAAIERVVIQELGAAPLELFDRFDRKPLASASIGQVHRARLRGIELAVKIQRPGAERDFNGDLRILRAFAWLIRHLGRRRWHWIADHLQEMARWTEQELDYRYEAGYGQLFSRQKGDALGTGHIGAFPFGTASDTGHAHGQEVPEVIERYSTRRVLTMRWLDGVTISSLWRDSPDAFAELDRSRFACQVIDNFLEQVFVHGLFHADLHPANLMAIRTFGPPSTGLDATTVGYLDFGIVGELSPFARQRLVAMTLAYARGDLRSMSKAMLDLSKAPDEQSASRHRERFLEIGERWYDRRPGQPRLRHSFTAVLLDMLALSRETGVWPERSVLKYVRSLMSIDALVARLAPGLDAGAYLESACSRLLAKRYSTRRSLAGRARRLARAGRRVEAVLERLADGRLLSIQLRSRGDAACSR